MQRRLGYCRIGNLQPRAGQTKASQQYIFPKAIGHVLPRAVAANLNKKLLETLKVVLGMGIFDSDCFDFLSFVEVPPWAPMYPWVDPLDPWVGPLYPWVVTIGFPGLSPGLPWTPWAPLDPWVSPMNPWAPQDHSTPID